MDFLPPTSNDTDRIWLRPSGRLGILREAVALPILFGPGPAICDRPRLRHPIFQYDLRNFHRTSFGWAALHGVFLKSVLLSAQ